MEQVAFWLEDHVTVFYFVLLGIGLLVAWWLRARKYREWSAAWLLLAQYVLAVAVGFGIGVAAHFIFFTKEW